MQSWNDIAVLQLAENIPTKFAPKSPGQPDSLMTLTPKTFVGALSNVTEDFTAKLQEDIEGVDLKAEAKELSLVVQSNPNAEVPKMFCDLLVGEI